MSFSTKEQNLGVVIVDAATFEDAFVAATAAKVNPGGAVAGVPLIYAGQPGHGAIDELPRLQLLTIDELRDRGVSPVKVKE